MKKMSKETKNQILELTKAGLSAKQVSIKLGIPVGSVGPIIFREKTKKVCPCCGKEFNHKRRKFCSAECRQKWWNSHLDQVKRRTESFYTKTCPYCGKVFTVYGDNTRKYCSHDCYCKARYKDHYKNYKEGDK